MGLFPLRPAEAPVADLRNPQVQVAAVHIMQDYLLPCCHHHLLWPGMLVPLWNYHLHLLQDSSCDSSRELFTIAITLRRQPFLNLLSNPVEGNFADPEWIRQKVIHLGIKQWNNCVVALLHPDSTSDKDV
ncbi:hypothetical protein DSO57_1031027 [Entomophthora muscae]|uniref:Uncharacterized protein n=1 Tax=Entomophthora muscae TaxID=34485 RepID=A0ACC2UKU0_9FUNG|nr:hypothetical protein DSO57_1031027 [Entomophthora muscae]